MNKIITAALCISSLYFYISCSDGIYGDCTSLDGQYCEGVYSCSSLDGVQYIKVGGARYNCARSLILEDSYDCSGGLAEAKKYCEDNVEPDPLIETCHKTEASGNVICYPGYIITKDQCTTCGWSYSAVECDEIANSLIISGSSCH